MFRPCILLLVLAPVLRADDKPTFNLVPSKSFPMKDCVLVHIGKKFAVNITDSAPVELPNTGPFEIHFTPKGGTAVLVAKEWMAKAGENKFALGDYLGTVYVLSDDQPRADKIVVTSEDDPGPGEKGHKPIQSAKDYKEDMVVPAGFYSVWVVPANGAKAQRIADRIRVLAGRETRVPE